MRYGDLQLFCQYNQVTTKNTKGTNLNERSSSFDADCLSHFPFHSNDPSIALFFCEFRAFRGSKLASLNRSVSEGFVCNILCLGES
jgi:hypothetical protein